MSYDTIGEGRLYDGVWEAVDMRDDLCDDPPFDNYDDLHYGAPWDAIQPSRLSEHTGLSTASRLARGGTVYACGLEPFDLSGLLIPYMRNS